MGPSVESVPKRRPPHFWVEGGEGALSNGKGPEHTGDFGTVSQFCTLSIIANGLKSCYHWQYFKKFYILTDKG